VNTLAHGLAASVFATTVGLIAGSLATRRTLVDRIQAAAFIDASDEGHAEYSGARHGALTLRELHVLVSQFVGVHRTEAHFAQFRATPGRRASGAQLESAQRLLGSVIGSASARRVIDAAASGKELVLEDVVTMVDSASRALEFNRELLQATMENVSQGISVVDAELRLVAWNQRYLRLFDYPPDLLHIGKPIQEVLEFNAARGELGAGEAAQLVARRMSHLRRGTDYVYQRVGPDGTVLEIRGNRMPGGGFVTSYTDVTEYKRIEAALEQRVSERTRALSAMNEELAAAKSAAEHANLGKTRFLAAASHDVLQPLNAAGLFAGALLQTLDGPEEKALVGDIEQCLRSAEGVLTDLLDISKLDAGVVQTQVNDLSVQDLFRALDAEFALTARARGLELRVRPSQAVVRSDVKLLRRVLQNFVANAIRYTLQGGVLIGCRRRGELLRIEVRDTGHRGRPAGAHLRGVLSRTCRQGGRCRGGQGLRPRSRHRRSHRAAARTSAHRPIDPRPRLDVRPRGAAWCGGPACRTPGTPAACRGFARRRARARDRQRRRGAARDGRTPRVLAMRSACGGLGAGAACACWLVPGCPDRGLSSRRRGHRGRGRSKSQGRGGRRTATHRDYRRWHRLDPGSSRGRRRCLLAQAGAAARIAWRAATGRVARRRSTLEGKRGDVLNLERLEDEGCLRAIARAELRERGGHVRLGRLLGDAEFGRDLLVELAEREQFEHPILLWRQAREARGDRRRSR
jgi:signal transduction histidine kinase